MATVQRMCEDSSEQVENKKGFCISGMNFDMSVDSQNSSPAVDGSDLCRGTEDTTGEVSEGDDNRLGTGGDWENDQGDDEAAFQNEGGTLDPEDEQETSGDFEYAGLGKGSEWEENRAEIEVPQCSESFEAHGTLGEDAGINPENTEDRNEPDSPEETVRDKESNDGQEDEEAGEIDVPESSEGQETSEKFEERDGEENRAEIEVPPCSESNNAHGTLGEDSDNNPENTEDRNEPDSPEETVRDKESNDSEDGQEDEETGEIDVPDVQNPPGTLEEDLGNNTEDRNEPDSPEEEAKSSSGSESSGSENTRASHHASSREGNEDWELSENNAEKGSDYQQVQEESQMTDLLNNFEILQKNDPLSDVDSKREVSKKGENTFSLKRKASPISRATKIMVKTLDQINAELKTQPTEHLDDSEIIVLDAHQSPKALDKDENSHQSVSEQSHQPDEIKKNSEISHDEKMTETSTTYSEPAEEEDSKSSNVESETSCVENAKTEEEHIIVVDETTRADKLKRGRPPKHPTPTQRSRIPPIRIKCADLEAKAAKIKQAATLQNNPDSRRRQYHRRCKPSVIIDGDDSPDECVVTNNDTKPFPTASPLKRKYECSAMYPKRPRFSQESASPPVDERVASSLLEKLQKSVGSALSITIKKKKPIAAETLNALEQLKNMSEISTTKITRSDSQAARPFRKTLPQTAKKTPAPAMNLPIITSVTSSKNETGPFFNVARRGKGRFSAPDERKTARSSTNSIPYVVLD